MTHQKEVWSPEILIRFYGEDILASEGMQQEKSYMQHGRVSVFEHSFKVTCLCLMIAHYLRIRVDRRALIRGALLHDYFLYDWHKPDKSHRLHGFTHARCALKNAAEDFPLNDVETDIILKHMFPLNISFPKYKESIIVSAADKICALLETLSVNYF